jgi:hypothetical protein
MEDVSIFCGHLGCQIVYFHTKNTNLGICIFEGLGIKNDGIFMVIWYSLRSSSKFCVNLAYFGIFCGYSVYFALFEMLNQKNLATLLSSRRKRLHRRERLRMVKDGAPTRLARLFLLQHTKMGKNIPNNPKIYQITGKYTNGP